MNSMFPTYTDEGEREMCRQNPRYVILNSRLYKKSIDIQILTQISYSCYLFPLAFD